MMNKILLLVLLISACSLAPKFKEPEISLLPKFKEQPNEIIIDGVFWKISADLPEADKTSWWKIFGQDDLNILQDNALTANQSLKSAFARLEQSRNVANSTKSGLFPAIDIGGNAVRAKSSSSTTAAFGSSSGDLKPYNIYGAGGVISYEADLFGRVKDSYKAAIFDAAEQESLYRNVMLSLHSDIASNYFLIRSLDAERKLLQDTVKIRQEANRIMHKRFKEGAASEQNAARTQSELASAEADLIAINRQRAKIEHALAILLGKTPAEFTFADNPLQNIVPPSVPAGLPSELLKRRPDIQAALSSMQAANARIGVAKAAFFPSLTLSASAGFSSSSLSNLFSSGAGSWALGQVAGNALALPVFHGGANSANLKTAEAVYNEAIANYRQQVLLAFKDVEDNLIDQNLLAEQSLKQDKAAKYAAKNSSLAKKRYNEGATDYFEVVDAERNWLLLERSNVQVVGQRFLTTIATIRALGGGW